MNKNKLIFVAAGSLVLLIVGTIFILEWFGPKPAMTLQLSGQPGAEVVGVVTMDGEAKDVRATMPATLTFEAHDLSFALVPRHKDVQVSVKVSVNGNEKMTMSSTSARGNVRHSFFGAYQRSFATTLSAQEMADLRK
jgi:hypothetical protein